MGWVKNFFDEVMRMQQDVLAMIPEEKQKLGWGRAAEVIIDGNGGGIFEFWFSDKGLQPKPEDVPIKNRVWMHEDTLLAIISPDLKLADMDVERLRKAVDAEGITKVSSRMMPKMDCRHAYANGLIKISGDASDVDSEEWSRMLERVLTWIAFPIVIRAMIGQATPTKKRR